MSRINNLSEIISNGEKSLTQGKRYAPTLTDLAPMLGVTRATLDRWRSKDFIILNKKPRPTGGVYPWGDHIIKYQYDLGEVIAALKELY